MCHMNNKTAEGCFLFEMERLFREENHGNVSGILTLKNLEGKKKKKKKKRRSPINKDSVFPLEERERQNVLELNTLIATS